MNADYSKNALKSLEAMDKKSADRVLVAVDKLPLGDVKRLKNMPSAFRLRIGGYRYFSTF